jgi:hypothetical protein
MNRSLVLTVLGLLAFGIHQPLASASKFCPNSIMTPKIIKEADGPGKEMSQLISFIRSAIPSGRVGAEMLTPTALVFDVVLLTESSEDGGYKIAFPRIGKDRKMVVGGQEYTMEQNFGNAFEIDLHPKIDNAWRVYQLANGDLRFTKSGREFEQNGRAEQIDYRVEFHVEQGRVVAGRVVQTRTSKGQDDLVSQSVPYEQTYEYEFSLAELVPAKSGPRG